MEGRHEAAPFVSLRGLGKEYPGVLALVDVSFDIAPGSVHGLVGENGAGKSTLIKLIAGALRPSAGEIEVAGQSYGTSPRVRRARWESGWWLRSARPAAT